MAKTFRYNEFDFEVEIGKVAKQANGAVWLKQGGTVILTTATSAPSKEFPGFLPLTVDYREQYSAAGLRVHRFCIALPCWPKRQYRQENHKPNQPLYPLDVHQGYPLY